MIIIIIITIISKIMVYLWYTYIIYLMCFNGFYEARGAVDSRDAQRMTPLHLCVSALSEDAQLEAGRGVGV